MNNKFNVLDPVLVYATIESINVSNDKLVYSLKIPQQDGTYDFIDFIEEENIQTVF